MFRPLSDLTSERLAELRRIAEAATPGPLTMYPCDDARYAAFVDAPHLGPDAPELAVFLIERDAHFFAEFDRDTVLALLDRIEALEQERDAARAEAERLRQQHKALQDGAGNTVCLTYLRFGDVPEGGRSKNHLTEDFEAGVSVYEGFIRNGEAYVVLPSATYSACVSLSACIERPCFEVTGEVVGVGSDGEPLLRDVSILRPTKVHGQEKVVLDRPDDFQSE